MSSADFLSLDASQMTLPRKADGSLPDIAFMHLTADSDLVDEGLDVGLPYYGAAPDLGAFEVVPEPSTAVLITGLLVVLGYSVGSRKIAPGTLIRSEPARTVQSHPGQTETGPG